MTISMTRPVGIDLGTTYSVAAIIEDGRAKVIKNAEMGDQRGTKVSVRLPNQRWKGVRKCLLSNKHQGRSW